MSITGQAAREELKDLILRIIERRIQATYNLELRIELLFLKREIMELDTD